MGVKRVSIIEFQKGHNLNGLQYWFSVVGFKIIGLQIV